MTAPARTIYVEKIHSTDPRLKRSIRHDSESRRYPFDTTGLEIQSVEHHRILPILNQGKIGKCTAEAGTGIMGTDPYYGADTPTLYSKAFGSFDDHGTNRLYNAEETIDGDGPFPPNDNGSSGLTLAKALRAAGLISGWTQVFTLADLLKALTVYPIACGTYWYNSMFDPDSQGNLTVTPSSGIAGGHEYECVGYDATTDRLKFANSWGTSWGAGGYFYMTPAAFGKLIARKGDATIFTPLSQPAPIPTPAPVEDADHKLVDVVNPWLLQPEVSEADAPLSKALGAWKTAKGL